MTAVSQTNTFTANTRSQPKGIIWRELLHLLPDTVLNEILGAAAFAEGSPSISPMYRFHQHSNDSPTFVAAVSILVFPLCWLRCTDFTNTPLSNVPKSLFFIHDCSLYFRATQGPPHQALITCKPHEGDPVCPGNIASYQDTNCCCHRCIYKYHKIFS